MIESQMLGPVPQAYRAHAANIRSQAGDLLVAIDDIDMAARIESNALELRAGEVPVGPLIDRIAEDLQALARLRGTNLDIYVGSADLAIDGDDRAVERLIARLMAALRGPSRRSVCRAVLAAVAPSMVPWISHSASS